MTSASAYRAIDPLALNYTGLITPLVKAVQELKADKENLRVRVESDEREIADLKRAIAAH